MEMMIFILEMVLPVLIMIILGFTCRNKGWVTKEGMVGIKAFISKVCIPVILFRAFYVAEYNWNSLIMFVIIFICCCLALVIGYFLRRFVANSPVLPFLLSGFEVGMLGYPLFGLVVGTDKLYYLATLDLGQTFFVYTVFLALLKGLAGNKPSLGKSLIEMSKNTAMRGVALGIIFGVTGLGTKLLDSMIGGIFQASVDMIVSPTVALILVMVGYELSLKKNLIGPVFKTILFRILINGFLLVIASLIIFQIIPFDKNMMIALMLLFSLPASFIIPIYAEGEQEAEFISTTLSVNTLVTVLLYILIVIYSVN